LGLLLRVVDVDSPWLRRFSGGLLQLSSTWGLVAIGGFFALFILNIFHIESWSPLIALKGGLIIISIVLLIIINSILWFSRYIITDQRAYERINPSIQKISFGTKFIVSLFVFILFSYALLFGV